MHYSVAPSIGRSSPPLLNLQGQRRKALTHVGIAGCEPYSTARRLTMMRSSAAGFRQYHNAAARSFEATTLAVDRPSPRGRSVAGLSDKAIKQSILQSACSLRRCTRPHLELWDAIPQVLSRLSRLKQEHSQPFRRSPEECVLPHSASSTCCTY